MIRYRYFVFLLICLFILGWTLFDQASSLPVLAQEPTPTLASPINSPHQTGDCLGCHSNPDMLGRFADGKTMSLYYDPQEHEGSDHIDGCRSCHDAQHDYPHKNSQDQSCDVCHAQFFGGNSERAPVFEITAYADERAVSMEINASCHKCHQEKFQEITDSEHVRVLERGNRYAPICVDCHGSHNITSPNEPRTRVAEMCSKCHMSVYTTYETSVHGEALAQANPDVPTCSNCHGSHVVEGTTHIDFRADSIGLCGSCHADKRLMNQYGISTNVFQTYLDDFHGRTAVSSHNAGEVKIEKATCYDCHGVHNIQSHENELSSVYPANLQKTCQQCHAEVGITFPQAWLSHYAPTWENTPLLFGITSIYKTLIPALLTVMGLYILIDVRRRVADRLKKYFGKSVSVSESQRVEK
jgi:hypothetical protein